MNVRHLGRSGLRVSPLCLGTMNFGESTPESEAHRILDRALELGIFFIDTADMYGQPNGQGVTESIIGRWFAQGGKRRERTVLATKAHENMQHPGIVDPNRGQGLSARKLIAACEESLRRLQTEWIDLHQMHHIDRSVPPEELLQAYDTLVRQGKVRYIGSSNFAGWDIATYCQIATQRHWVPLIAEQSVYNLGNRMVELEVIPACRHYGVGVLPWSPLGGGFLAGALSGEGTRRKVGWLVEKIAAQRPQLERYEALCAELAQPPGNVALAWLLHNPVVTAPILGVRTVEQLEALAGVPDLRLTAAALAELERIFPGPNGEAPKAYAW